MENLEIVKFYKNKTILITGNTGFKGSWLTKILIMFGAKVIGYSLKPNSIPNLYNQLHLENQVVQVYADIRDFEQLNNTILKYKPEIIFHLAAQPLVRDSYDNPKDTYEINVMGTVNLLESIRKCDFVKSVVNITTDKVYKNNEWVWGYRENETLDGYDPYSNSKSCSELVTATYIRSFFEDTEISISTARAGNVIGGGDYSKDRIIPDAIRAFEKKEELIIRNPNSIRPYQHVLEPLYAYLMIAYKQYGNKLLASEYNIGPDLDNCVSTFTLINLFNESLKRFDNQTLNVTFDKPIDNYHEANFLKLDNTKLKNTFNLRSLWQIDKAIDKITEFILSSPCEINIIIENQIKEYLKGDEIN